MYQPYENSTHDICSYKNVLLKSIILCNYIYESFTKTNIFLYEKCFFDISNSPLNIAITLIYLTVSILYYYFHLPTYLT